MTILILGCNCPLHFIQTHFIDRSIAAIGDSAKLVHYVALIGSHGIVQITHCRWHCRSLVTQRPLSLL